MSNIPKEATLEATVSLLQEGFPFMQNRVKRFHSDVFETRLMLEKVICIHGTEAVQLFYDNDKFIRTGAVPMRVQKTLLGKHGVQTMDDEDHRHRKAMFMSLMSRESIQNLLNHMDRFWRAYLDKWEKVDSTVLFEDAQEILCLTACAWAGVPLEPTQVRKRARDFTALVDAFGAVGPRHWRGRRARKRLEAWIMHIIKQVRVGNLKTTEGTALHTIAWHKGLDGKLLDLHMAAVELINLLRPIVAISWYITFSALALHEHPQYLEKLRQDDGKIAEYFVQEVRRFYPFAPFLGARVREDFDWKGYHFKKLTLVMLDVYGTLHDPRVWENPNEFIPERFQDWKGSPFDFIPQGGGDYMMGHRCAGEWITIEVTKRALSYLTRNMTYDVPQQDLSFSLVRMPTYPKSGFVIRNVRKLG